MTNKNKKELQPKLRFPEFCKDKDWIDETLSRLAAPVKEKAKKLTPNDVLTLSGEHGLVRQTEYFGKTIAGSDLKRYLRIEQNDFVYNDRTTSTAKYGSLKRLTDYPVGAVSPIYKCFRFKDKENPVFWEHYFNAGAHENALGEFINEGARAGRFNISVDTFLAISVCYPSPAEQQKIADCLGSLDDLIAAHRRKLDALQDHKKGLLQQLFPAEGETMPKLRFPEFEGEWEIQKLSKVCDRIMDGTHFSPKTSDGPRPYLTSKNIRNGFLELSTVSYISEEEHRAIYKRCPVRKSDILLTKDGASTGNCTINTLDFEFSLLSSVAVLRSKDDTIIPTFLYQLISSTKFQKQIADSISGQAITRITLTKIGNYIACFPENPEQQKIADCLSTLDALITAQTGRIATLKMHKKGLMQKLFPNPELKKA